MTPDPDAPATLTTPLPDLAPNTDAPVPPLAPKVGGQQRDEIKNQTAVAPPPPPAPAPDPFVTPAVEPAAPPVASDPNFQPFVPPQPDPGVLPAPTGAIPPPGLEPVAHVSADPFLAADPVSPPFVPPVPVHDDMFGDEPIAALPEGEPVIAEPPPPKEWPKPHSMLGQQVYYWLTAQQAEDTNRRRTYRGGPVIGQKHVGNMVAEGDVFPMMIVKVWETDDDKADDPAVNGQVFLDGNDVLWVTSVHVGDGPGPGNYS